VNVQPTVFVVDDDPGARRSMRWLLESEGLAVETFSCSADFLAAYEPDRPGCILLDLRMPGMDGTALQAHLAGRGPHPPIIFVTGHGDVPTCAEAIKAGAVDFLEKPVDDKRLLKLIRDALERDLRRRRVEARESQIATRLRRLTRREHETMLRMIEGEEIKSIAATFGISVQTVAKHRSHVLEKMEVRNEAELIRLLDGYPLEP